MGNPLSKVVRNWRGKKKEKKNKGKVKEEPIKDDVEIPATRTPSLNSEAFSSAETSSEKDVAVDNLDAETIRVNLKDGDTADPSKEQTVASSGLENSQFPTTPKVIYDVERASSGDCSYEEIPMNLDPDDDAKSSEATDDCRIFKIQLHCYKDQDTRSHQSKLSLLEKNGEDGQDVNSYSPVVSLREIKERLEKCKKKDVWVHIMIDYDYQVSYRHCAVMPAISHILDYVYPWITHLIIEDLSCQETMFLQKHAPLLDYLAFGGISSRLNFCKNPPLPHATLSQLKTLAFTHDTSFIPCNFNLKGLLEATHNLKEIRDIPIELVNFHLLRPEKLRLITSIYCSSENSKLKEKADQLLMLTKSAANLNLENIICLEEPITFRTHVDWKSCCKSLSTIIKENAKSLKRLEIQPRSHPNDLQLQEPLPVLKTLVLSDLHQSFKIGKRFFPEGFNINKTFPALQTLEIVGVSPGLTWLDSIWSPEQLKCGYQNLPTVRHLKLWTPWDTTTMSKDFIMDIALLFPRINTLNVGKSSMWLEEGLPAIWASWRHLEQLSVRVEWSSEMTSFKLKNLDENITGISEAKCEELRNSTGDCKENLSTLISQPAISNMKRMKWVHLMIMLNIMFDYVLQCLKRLSIVFEIYNDPAINYDVEDGPKPCVSELSAVYGFQRVPGLKVNLRLPYWDDNKRLIAAMFQPIIPHINFDSNYALED